MFGIVDRMLFRPPALMKRSGDGASRLLVPDVSRQGARRQRRAVRALQRYQRTGRRRSRAIAGYTQRDLAVGVGDAAREMRVGVVSASFFGFFDAPPALGRYFTAAEDSTPDRRAGRRAQLPMWQTQYGGGATRSAEDADRADRLHRHRRRAAGFVGLWADKPPAAFIPITSYGAARARNSGRKVELVDRRTAGDGCR